MKGPRKRSLKKRGSDVPRNQENRRSTSSQKHPRGASQIAGFESAKLWIASSSNYWRFRLPRKQSCKRMVVLALLAVCACSIFNWRKGNSMTSADTVAATTNLASHSTTWDVSDQPAGVGCPHDMPSHEASVAGMLEVCSIHARLRSVTLQLFGETAVTSDCYNRGGTYGRAHRPTGSTVSQAYANKFVLRLTDDLGYVDPVTLKNFGAPNVSLYDLFPGALSPDTPRDQIVTSVAVVTSTLHARWHLHDRSRGRPKCQKHLEELESQLLVYLLRAGEVLTTNRDNDGGSLRDIYDEWIEPRVYEARRYWDKVFESEQEHIQRAATTERDQQGWTFGRLLSLVPILGTGYGAGHQLDNTNVARAHLMDQIEDTKYYGWNRFIRKQLGWDEVCRQAQTMPRNCFA